MWAQVSAAAWASVVPRALPQHRTLTGLPQERALGPHAAAEEVGKVQESNDSYLVLPDLVRRLPVTMVSLVVITCIGWLREHPSGEMRSCHLHPSESRRGLHATGYIS